ncbi:unnamed protein product [Adineta steineri]|uniref:Uncharacterized protein n=1 Tax=Adineta steineri TaxID=433720 RepID=A0A816G1G2_9BILA|nr:unnamed protein product [Adineta steineri]CAF1668462.1 unnamed protein product [Adineta steineri]
MHSTDSITRKSSVTKSAEVIAYEVPGQPVQIVYDTWTPRPHFIIIQNQPKKDATSAELQATFELISHFLYKNSQFDTQAILSFHCGKWYQQHTPQWHAHLCVPYEEYLKEAQIQITKVGNNREWKGAKTVEEVWLSSSPRIGIVAQSPSTSNLGSLYTFMEKTRINAGKKLSQQDTRFTNFGCHLCLYVHGQSGTSVTCRQDRILMENGKFDDIINMVGYIQMDESQYVEWLPHNLRQVWLKEFRRAEHFVQT